MTSLYHYSSYKMKLFTAHDEPDGPTLLHDGRPALVALLTNFLPVHDILQLRAACAGAKELIKLCCTLESHYVSGNMPTVASGAAAKDYRRCFENARCMAAKCSKDWQDEDFAHFAGVPMVRFEYNYKFRAGFPIGDAALAHLDRAVEVKLNRLINVTGQGLAHLKRVKKLAIHAMSRLADDSLEPLGGMLEELHVDSLGRGHDHPSTVALTFGCIAHLRCLRSLVWHNKGRVYTEALAGVANTLQSLDICYAKVSDLRLSALPRLTRLTLSVVEGLCAAVLDGCPPSLTDVTLEDCHDGLTPALFKHLGHVTRLSILRCSGIRPECFAGLTSLSHLTLDSCLDLDEAAVVNMDSPRLHTLVVKRCMFLNNLAPLSNRLRVLRMSECAQVPLESLACLAQGQLTTLVVTLVGGLSWEEGMDKADLHASITPKDVADLVLSSPSLSHVWFGLATPPAKSVSPAAGTPSSSSSSQPYSIYRMGEGFMQEVAAYVEARGVPVQPASYRPSDGTAANVPFMWTGSVGAGALAPVDTSVTVQRRMMTGQDGEYGLALEIKRT